MVLMEFKRIISLEMETEDHYRKRANSYRRSAEYGKMVSLYPILETSIQECKGENLVA